MPMLQNPFWRRAFDRSRGGNVLVAPGEPMPAAPSGPSPLEQRISIGQQLAQQNAERDEQERRQREFEAGLREDQRQFNIGAGLDARQQDLRERQVVADAQLRQAGLRLDELDSRARNELARRTQAFREQQPNDLDLLQMRQVLGEQDQLFSDASSLLKDYRGKELDDKGRQKFNELEAKLRGIQSGNMRIEQKREMLGQWFRQFADADLESSVTPAKTIEDVIKSDLRQGPDGSWWTLDRDGRLRQATAPRANGEAAATPEEARLSPEIAFRRDHPDAESYGKAYKDARKAIMDRDRELNSLNENWKPKEPSEKEIREEMLRYYKMMADDYGPGHPTRTPPEVMRQSFAGAEPLDFADDPVAAPPVERSPGEPVGGLPLTAEYPSPKDLNFPEEPSGEFPNIKDFGLGEIQQMRESYHVVRSDEHFDNLLASGAVQPGDTIIDGLNGDIRSVPDTRPMFPGPPIGHTTGLKRLSTASHHKPPVAGDMTPEQAEYARERFAKLLETPREQITPEEARKAIQAGILAIESLSGTDKEKLDELISEMAEDDSGYWERLFGAVR